MPKAKPESRTDEELEGLYCTISDRNHISAHLRKKRGLVKKAYHKGPKAFTIRYAEVLIKGLEDPVTLQLGDIKVEKPKKKSDV